MSKYDAIVVGLGGMGSAALYQLARRGVKVLGLEQFAIGHDQGSSHGETRIIRKAYFEHPSYVPLLHRAYAMWAELEKEIGEKLFYRTGLLEIGRPDGVVIPGVWRSAREHNLPLEKIPISEVPRRFPGFAADEAMEAVFEADAGFLRVEACVQAYVHAAKAHGAKVHDRERVLSWTADQNGVAVSTESGNYRATRLVICGGPWSRELLANYHLPLVLRRKTVFWLRGVEDRYTIDSGCPVFCFDTQDGFYYGLPSFDRDILKVAEHTGGEEYAHPDPIARVVRPGEERRTLAFARRHLPGITGDILRTSVCIYTMTPDEHFIVDRCLDQTNVVFAAGFSGHGFKFAPVIGSVLADLALEGKTSAPVDFLRLSRPGMAEIGPKSAV